jgi:DNA-binding CsgD family transcriptional regulator
MPGKVVKTPVFSSYPKRDQNCSVIECVKIKNDSQAELFSTSEWKELIIDLGISQRQADVVWELLHGHSDKQIARQLGVSVGTVRTHLGRLFLRFGLQDRSELILYIFHHFRRKCRLIQCPLFDLHESI